MKAVPNKGAPTKHVGIWIRVSTEDQARGESPEHHERRARYYAEAKGWEVKEVYHLEGVSGKAVKAHPEAKRMMAEVKNGHITGLIFSKLARLARDTRELLDFSDLFREAEADLISIQESIDTSTPSGRLFYTMIAAMAQWEREEIVSRITASVAVRAKLGKSLGGKAPFGYQWKDKRLVLNPDEAPVRKLMYELFAEHKRKRTVARMLNERGFRTRKGDFTDTTVERLIRDTTAKGEHRTNYTRSAGTNKKWSLKPEHDWVINQVDPIVSIPLWEQCNELLNSNRTTRVRKGRPAVHAFTGFVQCECGEKMKVPSNSPKYICVKCKNKIPIEDLDNIFREELKGYLLSPEKLAVYLNGASETLAQKEELLQSLRREQGRIKREVEQLFALYHGGGLTPNQFKEHYSPIESRKAKLEAEIPNTEAEIALLKIDSLSSEEITAEAKIFYAKWPTLPSEGKRDLVEKIVQNIVIGNGEISINLCYMPSFENMAEKQRTLRGSSRLRA